jgi:LPXTG-motif cell wall-anchored protein
MSQPAGLDVRWPLGLLFAMIGALLLGHGLTQGEPATGEQATQINVWWGGVLLIFGASMLWLARRGRRKTG